MTKISKSTEKTAQTSDLTLTQKEVLISPIPDPDTLAKYERIQPGFSERLMSMAEREQNARITQNERLVDLEFKEANTRRWGLLFALFSVILVIALSFYAFWLGNPTQGAAIVVGGVLTNLAAVFVTKFLKNQK